MCTSGETNHRPSAMRMTERGFTYKVDATVIPLKTCERVRAADWFEVKRTVRTWGPCAMAHVNARDAYLRHNTRYLHRVCVRNKFRWHEIECVSRGFVQEITMICVPSLWFAIQASRTHTVISSCHRCTAQLRWCGEANNDVMREYITCVCSASATRC